MSSFLDKIGLVYILNKIKGRFIEKNDLDTKPTRNSNKPVTSDGIYLALSEKANSSHTHGNISNSGTLQLTSVAVGNGDNLVIIDASSSSKIAKASLTFDGSTTTQAISKKGTWLSFEVPTNKVTSLSSSSTDTEYPSAKAVYDAIQAGEQIQSDWNQTTTTAKDYIKNKPTNVSDFTNDAGYLTSYTETDPTVPAWAKASTKPTYTYSEVGAADKQLVFGTNFSQAPIFPYIHILSSGDILILNKFGFGLGETVYLRYDFPAMEVLYNQKMVRIAGINSPALEGTPTAPTAAAGTNTTQIATTEFVQNTVDSKIADIPDPVKPDWNATPGSTAEILNKPTIPAAQIQSDWNLTTTTSLDYIKNKPNIPITDYDIYAANLLVNASANYITEPEVKSVKINGSSTNSASSSNCVMQYDTTNKCLKFIFN